MTFEIKEKNPYTQKLSATTKKWTKTKPGPCRWLAKSKNYLSCRQYKKNFTDTFLLYFSNSLTDSKHQKHSRTTSEKKGFLCVKIVLNAQKSADKT
jgi:hypothetical protein